MIHRRLPSNALTRPALILLAFHLLLATTTLAWAQPIRLHPDNPRWFQYQGRATALITSAEHYGAVLNPDFDFRRYLDTLQHDGMNYTRIFAGSYVEPVGAFGIQHNTLAPAPGRFLAPWPRSAQPGYAGGGNKFDLDGFSPDYLARLKDFLTEARNRNILVELTLFCSTYSDQQWAVHPFNPTNNAQALPVPDWKKLHTLSTSPQPALNYQLQLTRWLVRELNSFDNLFFEIQNEPWSDNHAMGDFINPYLAEKYSFPNAVEITSPDSVAWQRAIAAAITTEEAPLPKRHLIAQNIANFRLPVSDADLVADAAILNFHYAYPESVDWNRGLHRAIGYDETGFAGSHDDTYRRQAWNFVLSGGALFNNLDYSFTVGHEDGSHTQNKAPGGGSPTLRRLLKVLSSFLHSFDLAQLNPDPILVERAPGVVARVLSAPGKAHALYLQGRGPTTLSLRLAKGTWTATWISTTDGTVLKTDHIKAGKHPTPIPSPDFTQEVALKLIKY